MIAAVVVGMTIILGSAFHHIAGSPRREAEPPTAEARLMADPPRAGPELERRLREKLTFSNGVLIVRGAVPSLPSLYVVATTTTWILHCDLLGMSVGFGGGFGEHGDGFDVELTRTALTEQQCETLAPPITQKLLAITQGN